MPFSRKSPMLFFAEIADVFLWKIGIHFCLSLHMKVETFDRVAYGFKIARTDLKSHMYKIRCKCDAKHYFLLKLVPNLNFR